MEQEFVHCNTGGSRRRPGGGAGGRGGVTLGWRPEHSVHSCVVTEMMVRAVGSHKEWRAEVCVATALLNTGVIQETWLGTAGHSCDS